MTDNAARILCRRCDHPLVMRQDGLFVEIVPGVQMVVHLAENSARLVCPRCGHKHKLRGVTFVAVAVLKQSAAA